MKKILFLIPLISLIAVGCNKAGDTTANTNTVTANTSATSTTSAQSNTNSSSTANSQVYANNQFGFQMNLIGNWSGYKVDQKVNTADKSMVLDFWLPTKPIGGDGKFIFLTLIVYKPADYAAEVAKENEKGFDGMPIASQGLLIKNSNYVIVEGPGPQDVAPPDVKLSDQEVEQSIKTLKFIK